MLFWKQSCKRNNTITKDFMVRPFAACIMWESCPTNFTLVNYTFFCIIALCTAGRKRWLWRLINTEAPGITRCSQNRSEKPLTWAVWITFREEGGSAHAQRVCAHLFRMISEPPISAPRRLKDTAAVTHNAYPKGCRKSCAKTRQTRKNLMPFWFRMS